MNISFARSSIILVPEAGIEPARPLFTKAADFKSDVSTNFTTRALFHALLHRLLDVLPSLVWRRESELNRSKRLCRPLHNLFAIPPWVGHCNGYPFFWYLERSNKKGSLQCFLILFGAGEESRTLDLNLGKVALYQLSYSRFAMYYFVAY